jgi:hypothetical protein
MHLVGIILGLFCIPLYIEINLFIAKYIKKKTSLLTQLDWWLICMITGYCIIITILSFFLNSNLIQSFEKILILMTILLVMIRGMVKLNLKYITPKIPLFKKIILACFNGFIASVLFFASLAFIFNNEPQIVPIEEFLLGGLIFSILCLPITTLYGLRFHKIILELND